MSTRIRRTAIPKLWDSRDGTHYFLVRETLYYLDVKALARSSEFLKNLVEGEWGTKDSRPDGSGKSLDDPVRIISDIGEQEFEIFALRAYSVHVNLPGYPDIVPLLRKLLFLGDYLISSSTLNYAFDEVEKHQYRFNAPELIEFCYRYRTRRFAAKSFERLVGETFTFSSITLEDAQKMGLTAVLILAKTKENMHRHLHNVACNPPELVHGDGCVDQAACEEDWRAGWWNSMGRFLLDAKNPLSWGEAVKRFQRTEFGRMGESCRKEVFSRIALGDGFFRGLTVREDAIRLLLSDINEIDPADDA